MESGVVQSARGKEGAELTGVRRAGLLFPRDLGPLHSLCLALSYPFCLSSFCTSWPPCAVPNDWMHGLSARIQGDLIFKTENVIPADGATLIRNRH